MYCGLESEMRIINGEPVACSPFQKAEPLVSYRPPASKGAPMLRTHQLVKRVASAASETGVPMFRPKDAELPTTMTLRMDRP